jgi:oligoribonuclease NrnB/cAMP/cGMP phosphodiesterase (DHH superfamily)
MMSKIYVLYHAHCTDGTGSKYAAWKKFGNEADYIAVNYGKPVPEMEPNSRVFILDFSYPRDVLEQLQSVHREVVVLDHHKTAEEALRGVKGCTFDMNKSGCVLAWEYFHPGESVPQLLLNIQDRDLWKFELENSKEVHAGLPFLKGHMLGWDFAACSRKDYETVVSNGRILLAKQQMDVENAAKYKVKIVDFCGYKVGVINMTDHMSEIGNAICESKDYKVDFAVCYGITNNDDVLLSLRSIGDFDVSEIAKKFGGGGHKNASGARLKLNKLVDLLEGKL